MEPKIFDVETEKPLSVLYKVTPLSKYLAMAIFIITPFIGGWIGYTYAPEKIVVTETIIYKNSAVESEASPTNLPAKEKPSYMIESGEIIVNTTNKTFEATVMFGLADIRNVSGIYLSKESIYKDVLQALNETGVNAEYVNTNTITIIELE